MAFNITRCLPALNGEVDPRLVFEAVDFMPLSYDSAYFETRDLPHINAPGELDWFWCEIDDPDVAGTVYVVDHNARKAWMVSVTHDFHNPIPDTEWLKCAAPSPQKTVRRKYTFRRALSRPLTVRLFTDGTAELYDSADGYARQFAKDRVSQAFNLARMYQHHRGSRKVCATA